MPRRVLGSILVALAVVGVLLGANLGGRRIAGTATPEPVPGPPRVGDCLLEPASGQLAAATSAGTPVLNIPTGRCRGESHGEVVFVAEDVADARVPAAGPAILERRDCVPHAREYVRHGITVWSVADGGPSWRPLAVRHLGLLGPDPYQVAAGQQWRACVAYPRNGAYFGTVRASAVGATSSEAAWAFSSCEATSLRGITVEVRCDDVHVVELFGTVRVDLTDAPSADVLLDSCGQLVSSLTGLADPTSGGELAVWVRTSPMAAPPQSGDDEQRYACGVETVGDRRLTRSLLGWENRPLPLA